LIPRGPNCCSTVSQALQWTTNGHVQSGCCIFPFVLWYREPVTGHAREITVHQILELILGINFSEWLTVLKFQHILASDWNRILIGQTANSCSQYSPDILLLWPFTFQRPRGDDKRRRTGRVTVVCLTL